MSDVCLSAKTIRHQQSVWKTEIVCSVTTFRAFVFVCFSCYSFDRCVRSYFFNTSKFFVCIFMGRTSIAEMIISVSAMVRLVRFQFAPPVFGGPCLYMFWWTFSSVRTHAQDRPTRGKRIEISQCVSAVHASDWFTRKMKLEIVECTENADLVDSFRHCP